MAITINSNSINNGNKSIPNYSTGIEYGTITEFNKVADDDGYRIGTYQFNHSGLYRIDSITAQVIAVGGLTPPDNIVSETKHSILGDTGTVTVKIQDSTDKSVECKVTINFTYISSTEQKMIGITFNSDGSISIDCTSLKVNGKTIS